MIQSSANASQVRNFVDTLILKTNTGAGMGRTNERIGRIQETYVANATTSWLESLERSLAQMKEYQVRPVHTHMDHTLTFAVGTKKVGEPSIGLRRIPS